MTVKTSVCVCAASGEDEPLVSHAVDSDIKVLNKDSLIMSKVRNFIVIFIIDDIEKFKL